MSSAIFTGQATPDGPSISGLLPSIRRLSFGRNRPKREALEGVGRAPQRWWETPSGLQEAKSVPCRTKAHKISATTNPASWYFLATRGANTACFACTSSTVHATATTNCYRNHFFIAHWLYIITSILYITAGQHWDSVAIVTIQHINTCLITAKSGTGALLLPWKQFCLGNQNDFFFVSSKDV